MTVIEILAQVQGKLKNCDPWKITHVEARKRILIFGDLIVCIAIIVWIIKHIFKKKK